MAAQFAPQAPTFAQVNQAQDILNRCPIRNAAWDLGTTGTYTAYSSELGDAKVARDPWNRVLPRVLRTDSNRENEVQGWHLVTTVYGLQVRLLIIND